MTEKKMLNKPRVCPVFLADHFATGSFLAKGKR